MNRFHCLASGFVTAVSVSRGIGYFLVAGSRHACLPAGRTHAQSLCRDSCTCVETQPCQQHAEWQHKTYGERLWSLAHGGRRDGTIQVQHPNPTLETLTLDQAWSPTRAWTLTLEQWLSWVQVRCRLQRTHASGLCLDRPERGRCHLPERAQGRARRVRCASDTRPRGNARRDAPHPVGNSSASSACSSAASAVSSSRCT